VVAAPLKIGWLSQQVCHLFHHPSMPGDTCAGALADGALNVAEME
jgi:hypothetical protein